MNWKDHINDIPVKLNRANALLFEIRNFVNITILKTIYFVIFDSHIIYANLVWAQNSNAMSRILTLQKKAMRTISSQSRNCHSSPLFSKLKLLKFNDKSSQVNFILDIRIYIHKKTIQFSITEINKAINFINY